MKTVIDAVSGGTSRTVHQALKTVLPQFFTTSEAIDAVDGIPIPAELKILDPGKVVALVMSARRLAQNLCVQSGRGRGRDSGAGADGTMRGLAGLQMICLAVVFGCSGETTPPGDDDTVEDPSFKFHLNVVEDEELLGELDRLEITLSYPDDQVFLEFGEGDIVETYSMPNLPAGSDVVFTVRGLAGGEEVAVGDGPPCEIGEGLECWALIHRHGAFVPLDGTHYHRIGHAVIAVEGGAVVAGGMGVGEFAPLCDLRRRDNGRYYLSERSEDVLASRMAVSKISGGELDGQVFMGGGEMSATGEGDLSDQYWVWNPATESFSVSAGQLASPRYFGRSVALDDGAVVLTGGIAEFTMDTVYLSNLVEEVTPPGNGSGATAAEISWLHETVAVGGDQAVTCGGVVISPTGTSVGTWTGCIVYNAGSGAASTAQGILDVARAGYDAVAIGDDASRVLLVGGFSGSQEFLPYTDADLPILDTAEILSFDGPPQSVATIQMVHPRAFPVAVRLSGSQQVLVCGGRDDVGVRSDCEMFDEATETFAEVEGLQLPTAAQSIVAAELWDGSVLFVGGDRGTTSAAAIGVIYYP